MVIVGNSATFCKTSIILDGSGSLSEGNIVKKSKQKTKKNTNVKIKMNRKFTCLKFSCMIKSFRPTVKGLLLWGIAAVSAPAAKPN